MEAPAGGGRRNTLDKPRNYPLPSPPPAHPRPFENGLGGRVTRRGALRSIRRGDRRSGAAGPPLDALPTDGGSGCMYHDNTSPILHTVRSAHQRRVQVDGMHTPTLPSCTSEGARCLRGATPPCLAMRPRRDGMGRTPQRDARVREFAPNLPWPPNGRHGCGAADWTGTGNRGPCSQRGCWATSMSSHKHGRMPRCEQRRPSRAVRDGAFCQCTKSKSLVARISL